VFNRFDVANIKYVIGDATQPQGEGKKIICHIVNDENRWGLGFVLALSKRWKQPEAMYRAKSDYTLGTVDIIQVEPDIYIANMIAQHGIRTQKLPNTEGKFVDVPPISYPALRASLNIVNELAYQMGASLHMPRIGTGLAGGKWELIEEIIHDVVSVDTYVYDLPERGVTFKTV
jgi:O-acetyl-ADP-ribose deacetylase (regulator of RNase III)